MKQFLSILSLTFLLMYMSGCSSSDTAEEQDELFEDGEAATETADTDFVPQEDMEFFDSNEASSENASQPIPDPVAPSSELGLPPSDSSFNSSQMTQTNPVGSGETVDYAVQAGDTLMKIAFHHYGDIYRWKDIFHSNKDKISDPNRISKGLSLRIEGATNFSAPTGTGEAYAIQTGDTLGKISSRVYGTPKKWKSLWENNKELIKNPNKIYAGFNLFYVPSEGSSPMETSQPLMGGAANESFQQTQEVPKMNEAPPAPPVTSFQETDPSSEEARDPSSVKGEMKDKKPAAQPEQLWNDNKDSDSGFNFE